MTPEQLAERLQQALPSALRSVVLYGSAAAGDHVGGRSDYNILVVVDRLGLTELNAISKSAIPWADGGNRPPLLFTPAQLAASADTFPIELLDMQQSHKVLFGEDPLAELRVTHGNLRPAVERELKANVLKLREHYVLTGGKQGLVAELMMSSFSTFLVLFRAALRLYREDVPARKQEVAAALAKHVDFDPLIFATVHDARSGACKVREIATPAAFEAYLTAVEKVAEAVERVRQ